MPTIVGILTFMIRLNFMPSWAEYEKSFITLGSGFQIQKQIQIINISVYQTWWKSQFVYKELDISSEISGENYYCHIHVHQCALCLDIVHILFIHCTSALVYKHLN